MSDSLSSLSDKEILNRTYALTVEERKLTLRLLRHLNEVERRKLFLKQAYSSMFDYCTRGLGYSTAAAVRRLQTARVIARYSQARELLERNEVNLSTVSRVARILTPGNATAVLERIRNKSQREVEAIVAEHDPLAAVPQDRVRTVMVRVPDANDYIRSGCESGTTRPGTSATEAANNVEGQPVAPAEAPNMPLLAAARLERRSVVQFAAHPEVMAMLDQVKAVASHRLAPGATFEDLIAFLAGYFLERESPAAREQRREARMKRASERPASVRVGSTGRYIPAQVRDAVFARDGHRCTYVASNGRRCESTRLLQLDHIVPVARGGATVIENLRLLCARHNRLEAERVMGEGVCNVTRAVNAGDSM